MKTIDENRIRAAATECGNAQGPDVSCFVANGFLRGARWMERELRRGTRQKGDRP